MNGKSLLGMLAAASAALVLSACGGPAAPADVTFVQGMVRHHIQAVAMAKQATGQAGSEQVEQLAARIEQGQGPEIEQMRGFLAAWGAPEDGAGMSGMDHGGPGGMSGMMTDAQMQHLGQVRGAEFDRLLLQMMIEHHTGAVQMARTELSAGQNPEAKALAQAIIEAQQSEIAEMRGILGTA